MRQRSGCEVVSVIMGLKVVAVCLRQVERKRKKQQDSFVICCHVNAFISLILRVLTLGQTSCFNFSSVKTTGLSQSTVTEDTLKEKERPAN